MNASYTSSVLMVCNQSKFINFAILNLTLISSGVAFLRQCAAGMFFDIVNRECDDMETATCISGASVNKLPGNSIVIPSVSFKCPVHFNYDYLLFPHQSKCEQFYMCNNGIAYLRDCPSDQVYDVKKEQCQPLLEAVCLKDL